MVLVSYSESSGSEAEEQPKIKPPLKINPGTSKPAFQKVVDRSNPHKIRVNLSEPAKEQPVGVEEEQDEDGQPPLAKKARTGGGALGGFNSFLPAPKRSAAANGAVGSRGGGLGSGVNLKTGAAPGFSRESLLTEPVPNSEENADAGDADGAGEARAGPPGSTSTKTNGISNQPSPQTPASLQQGAPKKQGNAMMFKPLSVAMKPQKKKTQPILSTSPPETSEQQQQKQKQPPIPPKPSPKISLFSSDPSPAPDSNPRASNPSAYEPIIYSTNPGPSPSTNNPSDPSPPPLPSSSSSTPPQSLSTIASDLNLSASATRQLLGRRTHHHHHNKSSPSSTTTTTTPTATKIIHFSTDAEYASNELLRQSGEQQAQQQQQQHNPVRALAPGKHSLKQLVSAASGQREALEEQFASGRRNRREAGGKYGW